MADNLTDVMESLITNYITTGTATGLTWPLKLALTTTIPTDATAGTEVTGGSYARQTITFSASSNGTQVSNNNVPTFTNLPATTVVGADIYDSSAVPIRVMHFPVSSTVVSAGNGIAVGIGAIAFSVT